MDKHHRRGRTRYLYPMVDGLFAAAFFYAADFPGSFPGKWWILYKVVGWIFLALALAGLVWCMRAACKYLM